MKIEIYKDSDEEQETPIGVFNLAPSKKSWDTVIDYCSLHKVEYPLSVIIDGYISLGWDEIDEWLLGGAPYWAR